MPLGGGRFEIGVHIADVTHFIQPDSALDLEAAKRGETFYMVNQRIDMVPKLLSEKLASLHPNVDRLAFSVFWEMDEKANIYSTRYAKTVIRSRNKLSYLEAQRLIDGQEIDSETNGAKVEEGEAKAKLVMQLRVLHSITRHLKTKRQALGALELASAEVGFDLERDADGFPTASSLPLGLNVKAPLETHSLIEELMVLANVTVARKLVADFPDNSLLRCHPNPEAADFKALVDALAQQGIKFDASSIEALQHSLIGCWKASDPNFAPVVRIACTRLISPAAYFCSGLLDEENWMHTGLAEPVYTHFTSPIRRYADQVVHRLLGHSIGWEETPASTLDHKKMEALTEQLNMQHTKAQACERASAELYTAIYLRDRQAEEDAYVMRVAAAGVTLLVPRYGLESFVFVPSADEPNGFKFDTATSTLMSKTCSLGMLDKVKVRIGTQKHPTRLRLALEIIEPEIGASRSSADMNAGSDVEREGGGDDEDPLRKKPRRAKKDAGEFGLDGNGRAERREKARKRAARNARSRKR